MLNKSLNSLSPDYSFNGIDIFKLVCAFMVCMIHIQPFPAPIFGVDMNFWLQNGICRVAVPFYFTTSGFLLFRKIDFNNIDKIRIKYYCFKLFRLLGVWTFLLFVGGTDHLWYLGALALAVLILAFLIQKGVSIFYLILLSIVAFVIGLLGDSYYGIITPLKEYGLTKLLIGGYDTIFRTTRNGVFFGLIFVLMGALFAKKRIVINTKVAFGGLFVSLMLLFYEVYLLKSLSHPKNWNMLASLLPVCFFCFYLTSHAEFKESDFYGRLRVIGLLIFFMHKFVNFFVELIIEIFMNKIRIDLLPFQFIITICITVLFAIAFERILSKEKFAFIKCILI